MPIHPNLVPNFDDLPKVKDMPQGCAWGLFDQNDKKDVFGTLNFLTPDIVKDASKEVHDGVSISLNWPLNAMSKIDIPGRPPPEHKIINLRESMGPGAGVSWDDSLSFNTQNSSQWDSLCHYQHQPSGLAYNGFKPSHENLSAQNTSHNEAPTLDHWHTRGGLVARGVLLDYKAYTEDEGIEFDAFDGTGVKVSDLEACAAHQGLELKAGDIMIVRLGGTELVEALTPEKLIEILGAYRLSGVEGSEKMARWLWNNRFAAVAGDSQSFERFPPVRADGSDGGMHELVLHQYLLSCFGMPIGEMWDLSRLSRYCREKKRYSFMLTSAPLNHPGLVGSPPNALAIF